MDQFVRWCWRWRDVIFWLAVFVALVLFWIGSYWGWF